jgi:hypothetical protein
MLSAILKPILWSLGATVLYAGLALAIFSVESTSVAAKPDEMTTGSIRK